MIRFPLVKCYSDTSEYIAHCDQQWAFISGFNGSAGEPGTFSPVDKGEKKIIIIFNLACAIVTLDDTTSSRTADISSKLKINWTSYDHV
jgi:hypothetical protein